MLYIVMKHRSRQIALLLLILGITGIASTGCKHTAHGAGEDIEHMGQKIQEKTQ